MLGIINIICNFAVQLNQNNMKLLSYAEITELGRAAEKGDEDAISTLQSYCIDLTASVKSLKDAIESVKDTSDRIESPN